jgi:hypothetical protein
MSTLTMLCRAWRQGGRAGRVLRDGLLILLGTTAGCSPEGLVGGGALPPDVPDPAVVKSATGAVAAYRGTVVAFRGAFGQSDGAGFALGSFIDVSGVLSDELQANTIGGPLGAIGGRGDASAIDSRTLPEYQDPTLDISAVYLPLYRALQKARGQAEEARGLLRAYTADSTRPLVGHTFALEGYSEIFLADLFCSGIPLSTVNYDGDYSYASGTTATGIYTHAAALFDSALALAGDSVRIVNLAYLGKGRALLALGRYAEASAAVAAVPDGYQYQELFAAATEATSRDANFATLPTFQALPWVATVAEREGNNGLDYRSSGDPRTSATSVGTTAFGVPLYHPDKYATDGSTPIVLADWVEARLIESEAALQGGDIGTWLGKLNHLRQMAITPALPDTTDPGTPDARVDLLFRERAFWLFLTGHRQGDLRRLVRQYGRDADQVYPSGSYPGGPGAYGSAVTAPIPATEGAYNPQYTGCIDRRA